MLFENNTFGSSTITVGSVTYKTGGNGARWKWTTDARRMTVNCYCEYSSAFNNNGRIAVLVNNVPYFFGAPQATGFYTTNIRLPPGAAKTVELLIPLQFASSAGGARLGVYPYFVQFDELATEISPSLQAAVLVGIGDSIMSGGVAISPAVYGYTGLMKRSVGAGGYNGSVITDSYGTRRLNDIAASSGAAATYATAVAALSPTKIFCHIGTNDQAVTPPIAKATHQTQCGFLLDALHTAMPSVPIVWLTPIRRNEGVTNSNGDTMADFRTVQAAAVNARIGIGWAHDPTLNDGLAIFADTSQYGSDLVHPNTAGNVTMQTAVMAIV